MRGQGDAAECRPLGPWRGAKEQGAWRFSGRAPQPAGMARFQTRRKRGAEGDAAECREAGGQVEGRDRPRKQVAGVRVHR